MIGVAILSILTVGSSSERNNDRERGNYDGYTAIVMCDDGSYVTTQFVRKSGVIRRI